MNDHAAPGLTSTSASAPGGLPSLRGPLLALGRPLPRTAMVAAERVTASDFWALPSFASPRWVVPAQPAAARRHGMALYAPGTWQGKLRKWMWQCRLRWPMLLGRRQRVRVDGLPAQGPLGALVSRVLQRRDWTMVLSVGTAGETQKITGLVVLPTGEQVAVVKLELQPGSRRALEQEAAMLSHLDGKALGISVPRLLGVDHTDVGFCLVQSVLPLEDLGTHLQPTHWQGLASLMREEPMRIAEYVAAGEFEVRLEAAKASMPTSCAKLCRESLELLVRRSVPLRSAIEHGDFAPWNTGRDEQAGRLGLFDWESGRPRSLPLLDALHFVFQAEYLLRRSTPAVILESLRKTVRSSAGQAYLAAAEVPAAETGHLAALYLLERILADELTIDPRPSALQSVRGGVLSLLIERIRREEPL